MIMRRIVTICAAAIAIAWGIPVFAQMGGMMGPAGQAGSGMRGGRFSSSAHEGPLITIMLEHGQELGLTPDQIQKLQELRVSFAKEAIRRSADIRAAEIDLNVLLEKDRWDLAAIEAQVKQIAAMQGDLRFARIKTLAAGRALLTPEQLQKLMAIGHWTPPAGGPGRMGPGQPYGPGWPGPMGPGPGYPHAPRQR
jgi:Spy/CpxP family protein refolding chaperone